MDEKLMESYLEKVAELVIDEDKIVTYKSLSKSLGIHVNTAKQLLYTFLTRQKSKNAFPISATYLLAGKLPNGSFNISIVNEVNLKSTCLKFVEVTSEHVYSIQKSENLKDIKVLYGADRDSSGTGSPLVIKCSKSILKAREVQQETEIGKELIKEALAPWKEAVGLLEANKKSEDCMNKHFAAKSPTKKIPKGNSTKAQADAKKPAGDIAKIFAKALQRNDDKSVNQDKSAFKNKQRDIEPAGASAIEVKEADLKTEKRSSEKDNVSKSSLKRKKIGNKRKRIQMISDSEDNDSGNEESVEEFSPLCFANIQDDKEEIKESMPIKKRKKRKIIDRTIMNEDGYLETKKEIVFETDNENDSEEERKADSEQKKAKVAPMSDKGKGVQNAHIAKKQSSLLAFFKKS